MFRPRAVEPLPKHEDTFVSRYQWLMGQALRLTGFDRQRAEDLVQDAYVQFILTRPDLAQIQNLEAYLQRALRNLHLSSLRRASIVEHVQLSVLDYDSAEIGLRALSAASRLLVEEDLRLVCHYARVRSKSSRIGGVLILRYFHGYFPGEIAQILRAPRRSVEDSLRLARQEARAYLENPSGLRFMAGEPYQRPGRTGSPSAPGEFLRELRGGIFERNPAACLPPKDLRRLYTEITAENPVECATLAHLVTCSGCLDKVNEILGLPRLSERSSDGSLGNEPRHKDGPPGGGPPVPSASEFSRKSRRRLRETIEHRPQELLVSVNGFVLSKHRVGLDRNEQTIKINLAEQIGFVEVFSEQGLRLGFLDVAPPTEGASEQFARAEFGDGRALEMALSFGGPWPTLRVVYVNPELRDDPEREAEPELNPLPRAGVWGARDRFDSGRFRRWPSIAGFLLRPWGVAGLISSILIALLILTRFTPAPIHAAELLRRSAKAERSITSRRDQVIRRIINFEERTVSGGKNPETLRHDGLVRRRRIEVWQGGERGVKALRLYDERQQLIAGEWTAPDGSRDIYQPGVKPRRISPATTTGAPTPLSFDEVWQLDPSAADFATLTGNAQDASVEDRQTVHLISYARKPAGSGPGLVSATIAISRDDLRPVEQTLTVSGGGELREYRFTESSYERRPARAVAGSVFEPESQLLGPDISGAAGNRPNPPAPDPSLPRLPTSTAPPVASFELEVDVLRYLNQVGADLGDQLNVTRGREGEVRVEGIVDTDSRKQEILRALGPVARNPAVRVEINTAREALRLRGREQSRGAAASAPGTEVVESVEAASSAIPAEADLRRRFSEEEARNYADRMVDRSRQMMRHAYALKRLLNQFSIDDLQALDPPTRSKWAALVRSHARSFEECSRDLRAGLKPVFFPGLSAPEPADSEDIPDDAALMRAVARLFEKGSFGDRAVRTALTISTGRADASAIKSPQFIDALYVAERLASQISSVR